MVRLERQWCELVYHPMENGFFWCQLGVCLITSSSGGIHWSRSLYFCWESTKSLSHLCSCFSTQKVQKYRKSVIRTHFILKMYMSNNESSLKDIDDLHELIQKPKLGVVF